MAKDTRTSLMVKLEYSDAAVQSMVLRVVSLAFLVAVMAIEGGKHEINDRGEEP